MRKVSICIPTYNSIADLKRLIRSIEVQTFTDYEICISDDSCTDEVEEFVRNLGRNINYRRNKKPLGHVINWNAAMDMASGEYIKIMFSDDYFTYRDSLERMVTMLDAHPECDMVFSNSLQVPENSEEGKNPRLGLLTDGIHYAVGNTNASAYVRLLEPGYIEKLHSDFRYVFISNQIGAPSDVLVRNKDFRFDERSNWASDTFFYMRILSTNPNFESTEDPLIAIGMHDEQYTYTFGEYDRRKYIDFKTLYKEYDLKRDKKYRDWFRAYAAENRRERLKRKIKKLLGYKGDRSTF